MKIMRRRRGLCLLPALCLSLALIPAASAYACGDAGPVSVNSPQRREARLDPGPGGYGEEGGAEARSLLDILLSPSGGAAEGLEPAEIFLSPSERYEINVFLSNFAEQNVSRDWNAWSYPGPAEELVSRQVRFVRIFRKINDYGAIRYRTWNGSSYETLTLDQVNETMDRFFGETISDAAAREQYPRTEYSFYDGGVFYFMAADGEAYNQFAVADYMGYVRDELYFVRFTVYGLDYETYFERGLSRAYYEMTPAEAAASPELYEAATCAAIVTPYVRNDRETYRLVEWVTW